MQAHDEGHLRQMCQVFQSLALSVPG